jgi:hypothetical protein
MNGTDFTGWGLARRRLVEVVPRAGPDRAVGAEGRMCTAGAPGHRWTNGEDKFSEMRVINERVIDNFFN